MQDKILNSLHASPIRGHSGYEVTYKKVKNLFAWHKLKDSLKHFVAHCTTCQQAKTDRAAYPGLLAPLPIPDGAWQVVTLDFIEGLPRSSGYNCILVVVDKFSKYAHFLPLSHPFTALQVAITYLDNVFKLHGLPFAMVSDRDKVFTSNIWQELFKLLGTDLRMSTAYHPQTDGQTERVNQCLETYLRCFVHACPTKWSKWLSMAEYWYNTSFHSSLGRSPFVVLYGHEPKHFGFDISQSCQSSDLAQWLSDRELMQQLVRQHLLRAQAKMKFQADKHRSDRVFNIGESVYLKA
jgi:transposase InsO family protein